MTAITRYPVDPAHSPLYRGDPVAILVTVKDNVGTDDAPVWEVRPLTGTHWRAHIRRSEDGQLLTKWTVTVAEDQPGATPADDGRLILSLTDVQARELVDQCQWDLEQVSDGNDNASTASLGTYWKVRSARVVKDVSHG